MYGVPDNLKAYHTSKKDIQEGLEVIPQEMYLLRREDIYKEMKVRMPASTPRAKRKTFDQDEEMSDTTASKRSLSARKEKSSDLLSNFMISRG